MEFAHGFHPPKTTTPDCSRKNEVHINRVLVDSVHARESNLGQEGDARFSRSNVERSALANERNKPIEQSRPILLFPARNFSMEWSPQECAKLRDTSLAPHCGHSQSAPADLRCGPVDTIADITVPAR